MPRQLGRANIPVLASAPSSPVEGDVYYNSGTDRAYIYDGAIWDPLNQYAFRTVHTWAVLGTIGATLNVPSFYFSKTAGQVTNIVKARYKVDTGTNVTFKIQKNGSDLTGYGTTGSPLTATTTAATTSSTQVLADDDELDLVIVGISGTPADLRVTVVLEHTI